MYNIYIYYYGNLLWPFESWRIHLYPYGLAHSPWQHAPAALSGSHEEASGVTWALKPTKKMSGWRVCWGEPHGHPFLKEVGTVSKNVNSTVENLSNNLDTFSPCAFCRSLELDLSAFKEKQGQGQEQRQTYRIRPEAGGRDLLGAFGMVWFWWFERAYYLAQLEKQTGDTGDIFVNRLWCFFWFKSCVRRLKKILRRRTRTCFVGLGGQLVDLRMAWRWSAVGLDLRSWYYLHHRSTLNPNQGELPSHFKMSEESPGAGVEEVQGEDRKGKTNGLFLFSILFWGSWLDYTFRKSHAKVGKESPMGWSIHVLSQNVLERLQRLT